MAKAGGKSGPGGAADGVRGGGGGARRLSHRSSCGQEEVEAVQWQLLLSTASDQHRLRGRDDEQRGHPNSDFSSPSAAHERYSLIQIPNAKLL